MLGLTSIAVLIASTVAAPTSGTVELISRQAIVQPFNTASCVIGHLTNTNFAEYDVHIGRPYIGESGCGYVLAALTSRVAVNDLHCIEDEAHTGTILHFSTGDDRASNDEIIAGLQVGYPEIVFKAQGICFKNYSKRFEQDSGVQYQGGLAPATIISTDPQTQRQTARDAALKLNEATCKVEHVENRHVARYTVHIGRPWAAGIGCQSIAETLRDLTVLDLRSPFKCFEDESATGTMLIFYATEEARYNIGVIAGLQFKYPDVPFLEKLICYKDYRKGEEQRLTLQDEIESRIASLSKETISKREENPYCNYGGNYYLSVNDVNVGIGIDGASKDFCAAHHGVLELIHDNTQDFQTYPGTSILFSMSNFCEGVEISEQECIDNLWIAGNSCKDETIYPDGVHMYGATYMTECAGYSVVPIPNGGKVEPPELFQCWAITCVPGLAGDEQCRYSSSRCANGCSSGGKCVA